MKYKKIVFLCLIFLLNPNVVLAHPGRTDSNGCHTCRTNCAYWGLKNGEYHCHNGGTTNNSSPQNNDTIISIPKSNDTSLKEVKINNDEITITDNMSYKTKKSLVSIQVITTDEKASAIYDNYVYLDIGNNEYEIIVTAEDGTKKIYLLNITREKILSSNTNIKIEVDNELIEFKDGKSTDTIAITSSENSLNVEYKLEDKNATAQVLNNNNLKTGNNEVIVRVTAENGDIKDYVLLVDKSSKLDDTINSLIGLVILGIIIYFIYHSTNHTKSKSKN